MNKRTLAVLVAAAIVVFGVVLGVSLASRGDDASTEIAGLAEVRAEVAGVPQSGSVLGDPDAPITIVEYGDLSCPFCKAASEESLPEVIERYVRPGTVKLEFRPIAFINASSERGAFAAFAASRQDALWSFVELAYRNQGPESSDWLTEARAEQFVRALGLDVERWRSDFDADRVVQALQRTTAQAEADQVRGTPTFIARSERGEYRLKDFSLDEFAAAVERLGRS